MEAIIRDGGRQYRVQEGGRIEIDYREVEPGTELTFDDVLLVRPDDGEARIGTPRVEGAKVRGKVVGQVKGPKLVVMRIRRRKNSRTRRGHRQPFTQVRIEAIEA